MADALPGAVAPIPAAVRAAIPHTEIERASSYGNSRLAHVDADACFSRHMASALPAGDTPLPDGPSRQRMSWHSADLAAIAQTFPATVIRLPSADGQAIQQHPPRGRLPKHVLSMWRARLDRSQAVAVFALDAQIKLAVEVRHACYLRCLALSEERREIERRDEAIRIEYKVLADLVRALEARRALAAKGGAA